MANIIILGSPGAGKGTQADLIAKKYNLVHLSSGKLLRQEVVSDSKLGREIKHYQDQGVLVPDKLLTKLIEASIKNNLTHTGFIFDGYPRSKQQAYILADILEKERLKLTLVLDLKISEKVALKRLLLRGQTSGRSDDNERTIKNRFHVYHQQTEPIIHYYQTQNKLITINGERAAEAVFADITRVLKGL